MKQKTVKPEQPYLADSGFVLLIERREISRANNSFKVAQDLELFKYYVAQQLTDYCHLVLLIKSAIVKMLIIKLSPPPCPPR